MPEDRVRVNGLLVRPASRPVPLPRRAPGIDQAHPRYLLPDAFSGPRLLPAMSRWQQRWGSPPIDTEARYSHAWWVGREASAPPQVVADHLAEVEHHDDATVAYLAANYQEVRRA